MLKDREKFSFYTGSKEYRYDRDHNVKLGSIPHFNWEDPSSKPKFSFYFVEKKEKDKKNPNQRSPFWDNTDKELEEAMIAYGAIKSKTHPRQPLFIDIIIRLMITRGFAKN